MKRKTENIPVVILCGGMGTRLSEETVVKPKPMVEIGEMPIIWHIMKIYAAYGLREFVLALGYKGEIIKDFFTNYVHRSHSLTVDMKRGSVEIHNGEHEDWKVHLLDTGTDTQTGGRVKQVAKFIGRKPFMLTYGDGVTDLSISRLLDFHRKQGRLATVTAVRPPARFGSLVFDGVLIARFEEKSQTGEGWINGGFFVLQPEAVDYIADDATIWEREPMERLAIEGQLAAFRHDGFWQCMDTLRDVRLLDSLWKSGKAPWKVW
jgi:glucose-1-phosphate cytidylyltransferase